MTTQQPMTNKTYLTNYIYALFVLCFSIAHAEEKEDIAVEGEPSKVAVIYIAEGTQTNLPEVAKIEKVKLVDKRKKAERKIKQKIKNQEKPISNQINKGTGEKIKEKKQKHFILNHKTGKTLLLSGYLKKHLNQRVEKDNFKIIQVNFKIGLNSFYHLNEKISAFYFSFNQRNAFVNQVFTRPPPVVQVI